MHIVNGEGLVFFKTKPVPGWFWVWLNQPLTSHAPFQVSQVLTSFFFQEAFRKVYEWKFMHCLELWTGAICAYSSEADFRPLAYPLTQIISGVARLVPTARYLPLRLRCVRMLNRLAASTGTFIPVTVLLLDMLDMKEFNRPPTGGVGKAVDLRTVLKVSQILIFLHLGFSMENTEV